MKIEHFLFFIHDPCSERAKVLQVLDMVVSTKELSMSARALDVYRL